MRKLKHKKAPDVRHEKPPIGSVDLMACRSLV